MSNRIKSPILLAVVTIFCLAGCQAPQPASKSKPITAQEIKSVLLRFSEMSGLQIRLTNDGKAYAAVRGEPFSLFLLNSKDHTSIVLAAARLVGEVSSGRYSATQYKGKYACFPRTERAEIVIETDNGTISYQLLDAKTPPASASPYPEALACVYQMMWNTACW